MLSIILFIFWCRGLEGDVGSECPCAVERIAVHVCHGRCCLGIPSVVDVAAFPEVGACDGEAYGAEHFLFVEHALRQGVSYGDVLQAEVSAFVL